MRPTWQSDSRWTSPDPQRIERRIRALAPRIPDTQFFSHLSAAGMWGLPLPSRGTGEPLHMSVLSPHPRPRANGILGHELDGRVTTIVRIDDIPVADPTSTWCQLASMLSIPDLVAVADAMVMPEGDAAPLCTLSELDEAVNVRRGHRGAGQLREALDMVRIGSQSRVESVLRVLMNLAELPEPRLRFHLDSPDGALNTVIPIAFTDYRVGVDVHLESDRAFRVRSAELERLARLDDLGWKLLAFSDADIHASRQYELRQKLISLQNLLIQQGWVPGSAP
ncbi:MAG: hypothetical protein ACKOXM_04310 [Agromyces sp.]